MQSLRFFSLLGFAVLLFVQSKSVAAAELQSHADVVAHLQQKAKSTGFDLAKYIGMLDNTAAGLIDHNPGLGPDYPIWILPSPAYPEVYSRDAFWTLAGYEKNNYLKTISDMFSQNAQHSSWNPALNGQISTIIRKKETNPPDGRRYDESTMFWVLSAKFSGKNVVSEPYLKASYNWLKQSVTKDGFSVVSHGWIDAWEPVKTPVVSANNQGLYVVTLQALRDMGVAVPTEEIEAAKTAYRNLAKDGILRAYQGSTVIDVSSLMGEALSLYLWNESILDSQVVKATIGKFAPAFYEDGDFLGYKCLSNEDGSYLKESEFWEIATRDPGNYQNGGSWLLYEVLALYAGARHSNLKTDDAYITRFIGRLNSEVKYDYSSKELICTGGTCGNCNTNDCVCPNGKCGLGSYHKIRIFYGWNVFTKRLLH